MPQPLLSLLAIVSIYNFAWGIFNLIPVPPLDGSWILFAFLKERQNGLKIFLEQYGFLLLLLLIFSGLHWVFDAAVFLYYLFG